MSFDLAVLALSAGEDEETARRMLERCSGRVHPEGDLDPRIVAFYDELRAVFPDHGSADEGSPWMSTPLDVGVDHVIMNMSFGSRSDEALRKVEELAGRHRLAIYDFQSGEVHYPECPDGGSGEHGPATSASQASADLGGTVDALDLLDLAADSYARRRPARG